MGRGQLVDQNLTSFSRVQYVLRLRGRQPGSRHYICSTYRRRRTSRARGPSRGLGGPTRSLAMIKTAGYEEPEDVDGERAF